jgi:hypothetical protein
MQFYKACVEMDKGNKVRYSSWSKDHYIYKIGTQIFDEDHVNVTCMIKRNEAFTSGWSLYEIPEHNFEWAVRQHKLGENVKRKIWGNYYWMASEVIAAKRNHEDVITLTNEDIYAEDWIPEWKGPLY